MLSGFNPVEHVSQMQHLHTFSRKRQVTKTHHLMTSWYPGILTSWGWRIRIQRRIDRFAWTIYNIWYGCWTKNRGVYPPKWMVYFMENPIKMDDLGVFLFLETPILVHLPFALFWSDCQVEIPLPGSCTEEKYLNILINYISDQIRESRKSQKLLVL